MKRMLPLALIILCAAGCTSAGKSSRPRGARSPTYVYTAPGGDAIQRRANELQARGRSPDAALTQAKAEAARQAWQVDSSEAWADEQARRRFQQKQDKLNNELRKMLKETNQPSGSF